ncbi:hypothetical protein NHX12_016841 [Muraenolepis orangiensis]|uniref:Uncharacterized protein n=1 Tax=Muraenolepis orangiensis TaxID=630683 RepID=A0A9Q0D3Q7_9TELE|nr:hypothetical protein NHX12_016841 [Muraenolepis orangiensis]
MGPALEDLHLPHGHGARPGGPPPTTRAWGPPWRTSTYHTGMGPALEDPHLPHGRGARPGGPPPTTRAWGLFTEVMTWEKVQRCISTQDNAIFQYILDHI